MENTENADQSEQIQKSGQEAGWLVRVAVFNPYLVIVLCLFIAVLGFVSARRVPVDVLPAYDSPAVQVVTLYPGMPTEIMDRTITNRIERWTGQAVGIERQESRTMIGVSVVRDYFAEGTDPNAAFAQVASLAAADLYYLPPGTAYPMAMLYDPTAPMPTAYLVASSEVLDETKVYELAYFNVRNMLQGTPGVVAPAVFGGKLRRIYAYLDPSELQARGLSLMDVQEKLKEGSPLIPPGTIRFGEDARYPFLKFKDALVNLNFMPEHARDLDFITVKAERDKLDPVRKQVLIRDLGDQAKWSAKNAKDMAKKNKDGKTIADTAAIQTNMVRITRAPAWEGKETVMIPIFRRPKSNTIQVVEGVKNSIPTFLDRLPVREGEKDSGLKLDVVADQSVFVRSAISSLVWEGLLGAVLASLMVLLFIGSFRSTVVIALTIPLSIMVAVVGLYFTGNTLNLMTLGGLALVMGRLVDDPIVDIENTFRHLDMGKSPVQAALDSAREIAMPVLVATITTVAVFFPVIFLYGMGKYLFKPLALSVAFAMFASYLLSRTLSPAYCAYMLKAHAPGEKRFWLFRVCDAGYEQLRRFYQGLLNQALSWRGAVVAGAVVLLLASFALYPLIGRELFPTTDGGQIIINMRAAPGTEIRKTREIISGEEIAKDGTRKRVRRSVEDVIKEVISETDRQMIVSDLGVLYDWPAGYTANAGPMDATILVQLSEAHERSTSSQEYARRLREAFAKDKDFHDVQFAFNTGGMVSAALNFGLASPINLQVRGRNLQQQYEIARDLKKRIAEVRGAVDVRIQQTIDYPTVEIELDRQKMADLGITMEDAAKNMLAFLRGSDTFDPAFWIDNVSGNHVYLGVTVREESITWQNLMQTTIRGKSRPPHPTLSPYARGRGQGEGAPPQQLQNLIAKVSWDKKTAVEINHNALARVIDVFVNVDGRDVGSVAADIERVLSDWGKRQDAKGAVLTWSVPDPARPGEMLPGYAVDMRGEVSNMTESFSSLGFGFILATILIYLIMVAQFRSFLDPFIILIAVPLGLIGVLIILAATGTTLNVQSALGVIFMVGIAVSNSILLVEFANRLRSEKGLSARDAALQSAGVRLRPILMTSLAAVVGLLPLALKPGEATTPLALAVIGGLTVSTLLTIFVVPCLYVMFKGRSAPRTTSI